MPKELAKQYAPQGTEDRIYQNWCDKGYFHTQIDRSKKPFTIVMPPPNVTGQLHMGHAMDETWQDILTRYKRMQGYAALWVPGTDHASIATEAKVVAKMREEGLTKEMVGRDGFLERAWDWKNTYGNRIVSQLKKLGCSCDWQRERFTMDEGCSDAVKEVFVRLYNEGLIYRGNRMVNWCPCCNTSISDAEVEYQEQEGHFWHLLYTVKETGEQLELATTRPETMLGDTAVAINENDPRYAHLHGCHVILPLMNVEIPIVCDEHADMEKGTGVVKITPAHDPNDFEVGQRHNLPIVRVFTYDGRMTGAKEKAENDALFASGKATVGEPRVIDCGKYAGMTTMEARKAIVKDLEAGGYLKRVEPLAHEVGTCYRCHTTIEPMVSKQWFVKMAPLAKPAVECVRSGEVRFVPERFAKNYMTWMENIRDWCISRQLWWGHRIPAWYCDDCGEVIVARETPTVCPKCGCTHLAQDEDVLDTWFSSALWPFSTLGWPEQTADLSYFYPTSVLVTGYDIIFFWVARMIFDAFKMTNQRPFKDVLIHGLVLDQHGQKMSKSKGNGIDPLEEIEKYGADALRMTLITGVTPGNDVRYRAEKIEASRNFTNKLWNAARFVLMNLDGFDGTLSAEPPATADDIDQWIITRFYEIAAKMGAELDHYDYGEAAKTIRDFIWNEFCDWYIELIKPRLYGKISEESKAQAQAVAAWVLRETCVLLHPIMPFITEEIWQHLPHDGQSIIVAKWPENTAGIYYQEAYDKMVFFMDLVKAIRSMRHDMGIPTGKKSALQIHCHNAAQEAVIKAYEVQLKTLAYAESVELLADVAAAEKQSVSTVCHGAEVILPLAGVLDIADELARLDKEIARLEGEVTRAEKKLANEGFVKKAPAAVVEAEKEKVENYKLDLETVQKRRDFLASL